MPSFYKYADSPTVYNSQTNQAYSTPEQFYAAGGARDWSGIETRAAQPATYGFMDNSSYNVQGQQVTPAPTPAPTVITSQPARTATVQNLNTLSQAEQGLTQQNQQSPLQQVYSTRPDLQALYDEQGQARNVNDPRINNMPTLQDWALRFGVNESPALKTYTSNNPALQAMMTTINDQFAKGIPLTPEQRALFDGASQLGTNELKTLATASQAAQSKDYKGLNDYMTQLQEIRKQQADYVTRLFEAMKATPQETQLAGQLNDITNQERNVNLRAQAGLDEIGGQQIALKFVQGEQAQLLKQANLRLQTLAAEKAPLIDQLQLAQATRTSSVEALKAAIQYSQDDTSLTLKLAEFAQELEKTQQTEAKAAKDLAIDKGITKPFYLLGSTVYRTADGKAYSDEKAAAADGVDIKNWSNVQELKPKPVELSSGQRLVDPTTGQTIAGAQYKGSSGGGGGTTSKSSDIEDYAQGVYSGSMKISQVPIKIRGKVDARVKELQQDKSQQYDTEFEARVDYDQEIADLERAVKAGESLAAKPSEIIETLYNDYGGKISKQEITSTIYNILGIKR